MRLPLRFASILGVLAALLLPADPSQASVISLDTQVAASVEGDALTGSVTLTNRGDEPAYNLQTTVESQEASWTSPAKDVLPPQQSHTVAFREAVKGLLPGRHPLVIRTTYSDANRYPFSALAVSQVTIGQASAPGALGILGHARLDRQGSVELRLKNLTAKEQRLAVRLVLPQELSVDAPLGSMTLAPYGEARSAFHLRNFSALSGSTYPMFAVIEYDDGGTHETVVAAGTVRVESPTGAVRYRKTFLYAFLALFLTVIILNVLARRKRSSLDVPPRASHSGRPPEQEQEPAANVSRVESRESGAHAEGS